MKNPIVVLLITSVVTVMVLLYNPKDKTEQIPLQIYTTEDILFLDKVEGVWVLQSERAGLIGVYSSGNYGDAMRKIEELSPVIFNNNNHE